MQQSEAATFPTWKVVGAADITGDGKPDILLRSINGHAGAWPMSGTTVHFQPTLGSNPETAWHFITGSGG